jgi:hypothetical protein
MSNQYRNYCDNCDCYWCEENRKHDQEQHEIGLMMDQMNWNMNKIECAELIHKSPIESWKIFSRMETYFGIDTAIAVSNAYDKLYS